MHHLAASSVMLNEELQSRHCLLNILIKDDGMGLVCSTQGRDDGIHLPGEVGLAAGLFENGQC
jgi:hypothetical protein